MTIQSTVIREALEAEAERAVSSEVDLWPAISAAAIARPMNKKSPLALGPVRLHRAATFRIGAALLLALVILVAGVLLPNRDQRAAAAVLNELAAIAALQPAPLPVGASGYQYTKTDEMYLSMIVDATNGEPLAVLVPKTRSLWIAADGSGRIRETTGAPIYLNERSRSGWDAAGVRGLLLPINEDFGPQQLSFEDLSDLPTDPTALAGVIRERAQRTDPPLPDAMFVVIGDLLRQQSAPPAVRAALYKVVAGIPGVELVGHVHDRAGRPGVAVAMTSTYSGLKQRNVLIFDERTSALLAEETVLLEAAKWMDAKPPFVIGYATYLEAAIVERLPAE